MQIAYRQHPDERAIRQQQLAAVIAAWRAAPRNEANNERLSNWLHEAIRTSMPGSHEPLPASPIFAAAPKIESRLVDRADAQKAIVEPMNVQADPFRDDPATQPE